MAYLNKTVVLKEINCSKIKIKKHSGNFESTGFVKIMRNGAEKTYTLEIQFTETEFKSKVMDNFFSNIF